MFIAFSDVYVILCGLAGNRGTKRRHSVHPGRGKVCSPLCKLLPKLHLISSCIPCYENQRTKMIFFSSTISVQLLANVNFTVSFLTDITCFRATLPANSLSLSLLVKDGIHVVSAVFRNQWDLIACRLI